MQKTPNALRRSAALFALLCLGGTAVAQTAPRATRSQNVTINLINRLVERGALTPADASELIRMAEEDAAAAKAEAAAAAPAPAPAPVAVAKTAPAEEAVPSDTVRVTYIPEAVKRQMVEEIRGEVMDQAVAERWAAPRTLPEWTERLKLFGDFRFRYEGLYYPHGNDNTGAFPNFNSINTGAPFDITGTVFSPQLNVDQERSRLRIRARGGLAADLGENFSSGLRLATGENNSPVTQNQSLGGSGNAQGGNFAKYAVWLDRAFLKYEYNAHPGETYTATVGRFDNPFFATSLLWADDLGFDGAVVQGKHPFGEKISPYITAGVFPVFNTDLNFSTTQPAKFKSQDKWLKAVQVGADAAVGEAVSLKLGAAYYDFQNIEGRLSTPFTPVVSSDNGDTDALRPAFAQKGNTYMALRSIIPSALNNFGAINQWQYFGLATPFRDLAFTGRIDLHSFDPIQVSLGGELVRNLAFDQGRIAPKAVNNLGATSSVFVGGDTGWTASLRIGTAALEKRWDWNVNAGYRYVESDAVVDGFNDSDFGGGGTNLKGVILSANLSLSARVWLGVRWFSANSISGPAYKQDTLQIDTNAKF